MFKIANNVENPLQHVMLLWKVELTSNKQTLILLRGLHITSTIHNWSYPFNAHSKKVIGKNK